MTTSKETDKNGEKADQQNSGENKRSTGSKGAVDDKDMLESRGFFRDLANLKKLWPYAREGKLPLFLALGLIPVVSVIQIFKPQILRFAIDLGVVAGDSEKLHQYSAILLSLVIGEYLSRTTQAYAAGIAVHKMVLRLRRRMVEHVLRLKAGFHDRSLSGALVTRSTSDFDNLSESLSMGVLRSVVDMASLVGSAVGMLILDWRLALVSLAVLPIVIQGISWFSKVLKGMMLVARGKLASVNAYAQECLFGNTTIKILSAGKQAASRFRGLNHGYRNAQMKVVFMDAMIYSVLDGIASIMIGLTIWVAISEVFGLSGITVGVVVAFVQYVQRTFEPLKQLGSTMAMLQGVFTAIDRIFGIMETKEFISGSKKIHKISGDVVFDHVNFAYAKDKGSGEPQRILRDISFHVKSGHSIALVGPTGSGKSTIIKLLSKLYDGYQGKILIDGEDLNALDGESLRSQISIVPQDIVLFDGSIEFNIGLGLPDISRDDVVRAAKLVGADKFIDKLPQGYESEIKEQGGNLSHGQKQLIAFARALARNPGLVILDEATSSVDPQSEAVIQQATTRILKEKSVVVIAHRLSTIRECDQIHVIRDGEIVESGNHDELLAAGGVYSNLHGILLDA